MITNSTFHRLMVRFQGMVDGRKEIPSSDSEQHPQAIKNLLGRANTHLSQIQKKAREKNRRLHGLQKTLSDEYNEVNERYEEAKETYAARRRELGRDVDLKLPRAAYWTLMSFVVIAELPFNWSVFNAVSDESALMTMIMSFVVSLTIPLAAHFVGTWVQQWHEGWKTAAEVIGLVTFVVAGLWGVYLVRLAMLSDSTIDTVQSSADSLGYAYFIINIMVFVIASVAAMFTHDKDHDFEGQKNTADRLSNKRRALVRRREKIKSQRDELLVKTQEQLHIVKGITSDLASLYRRANNRNRPSGSERPKVFETSLDFEEDRLWAFTDSDT